MPIFHKPALLYWTEHSKYKMRQYACSPSRARRVMNAPKRVEEGIAPKTVAFMQPVSLKTKDGRVFWTQEFWVMAQDTKDARGTRVRKIISVWRYPGVTKAGRPLPKDFIRELQNLIEEGS